MGQGMLPNYAGHAASGLQVGQEVKVTNLGWRRIFGDARIEVVVVVDGFSALTDKGTPLSCCHPNFSVTEGWAKRIHLNLLAMWRLHKGGDLKDVKKALAEYNAPAFQNL